jgi:TRAP-type mannitol/chloroaromatic compound transport system permease small subunit
VPACGGVADGAVAGRACVLYSDSRSRRSTIVTLLLRLCRAIDAINDRIGRIVMWLVLAAVLVSAINASVRKAFGISSNAYLELQWYLFSAVFLLGAGYTLLKNEHVRIDAVSGRWSRRTQVWVDVVGFIVFLLPLCAWVVWMSWPVFKMAYVGGEMSSNAGGLIRWPVYLLLPVGFVLLALQAFSELVKRIAWLRGLGPDPAAEVRQRAAEDVLAEELRKRQNAEAAR